MDWPGYNKIAAGVFGVSMLVSVGLEQVWIGVAIMLPVIWGAIFVVYRKPLGACWREPVLNRPVLSLQSDLWGAGPLTQVAALQALASTLNGVRDQAGRPAVISLGLLLEIPETPFLAPAWRMVSLADPRFAALRETLASGVGQRVFSMQLNGGAPGWPESLRAAADRDERVAAWLSTPDFPAIEALPLAMRSRWLDASQLPSRAHDAERTYTAAQAEVELYRQIFGHWPRVVAPDTGVWNEMVESGWATAGVEVIVTSGCRYAALNKNGQLEASLNCIFPGQLSEAGQIYLVKEAWGQPVGADAPDRLVNAVLARYQQGRPCLMDVPREIFLAPGGDPGPALETLTQALRLVRARCPELRFLASWEIANLYRNLPAEWMARRLGDRFAVWLRRIHSLRGFRLASRASGLALIQAMLRRVFPGPAC
jgi:hypothetical protein